jgi:hypothetical protein
LASTDTSNRIPAVFKGDKMLYKTLANALLIVHLLFIIFVVLGGLLLLWDKRWAYVHLPAMIWGATIEFTGGICPLTPLENKFRVAGGLAGYKEGFIEHYLVPLIYPPGLTPNIQLMLAILVLGINLIVYGFMTKRWLTRRQRPGSD